MRNIQSCLQAANSSLSKVVRRRIYIIDIKQFREVDAIWAEWVGPPYPVSTCVQVCWPHLIFLVRGVVSRWKDLYC